MRVFAALAGLLVCGVSSIALASGTPNLFDGGPLEDTLAELRAEAGIAPALFHYHIDVEATPSKPEVGDPARPSFTLPVIKRTSSIVWDERAASWRKKALSVKAVRIDLGLSHHVFVSPAVPEGSCRWHAAFEHEKANVQRFSKIFFAALPDLKASLEAEAVRLNLPSASAPAILKEGEASRSREAAAERLSGVLERHAASVLAKMEAERESVAQTQSYARLVNACAPRVASGTSLDQGRAKPQLLVP